MDLTCPICRQPLGQGGNRNLGFPPVIWICYSQICLELHSSLSCLGLIYSSLSQSLFYFLGRCYVDVFLKVLLRRSQISLLSMFGNFSLNILQIQLTLHLGCNFYNSQISFSKKTQSLFCDYNFILISVSPTSLFIFISLVSHLTSWSNSYCVLISYCMISEESTFFK